MKLHAYVNVFKMFASGQPLNPAECTREESPRRTVTFTTALDLHSLLPAVQPAGQIEMKK